MSDENSGNGAGKTAKSHEMTAEELLAQFSDDPLALPEEDHEAGDPEIEASNVEENTRKRGERDRRDAEVYGGTKLARDLLSVYDNMNRAIEAIDDELREKASALIEGIDLTRKDLLNVFEKHNIVKIEPEYGEKFDPKQHQAMFEAPVPNAPAGTIIQVMNAGFNIGERLYPCP